MRAHQEDSKEWEDLERESQLIYGCDYAAKEELVEIDPEDITVQKQFPLEPATLFTDSHKITTESGPVIRYSAQRQEAKSVIHEHGVLLGDTLEEVAWRDVYAALHSVPKMFQIFACKQASV